ncbi:MAG: hypothetical protein JRI62_09700 [Deltaproteobacteria bacterium]|nr:hypothetical protein [Deltaproteobacteria bacterium]
MTAWLYQFVGGRKGELRYKVPSGLGRMDILLIYHGHKYIIETKINRSHGDRALNKANKGGRVMFTPKTCGGWKGDIEF